ncbi:MAG: hypothetical protein AB7S75_17470 [Desulfococcaceae bacterium]
MEMITESEFVKDTGNILNRLLSGGKEIVITRKNQEIAKVIPFTRKMTAAEAMSDIYGIISEDAGKDWYADSRLSDSLRET